MKKLAIIIAATSILYANGQNIIIHQNNSKSTNATQQNQQIYVNGIPMSEDIGGVETNFTWVTDPGNFNNKLYFVSFTNYNDFTVNVNYEIDNNSGTLVLKAGQTKKEGYFKSASKIRLVARPIGQKTKTKKNKRK